MASFEQEASSPSSPSPSEKPLLAGKNPLPAPPSDAEKVAADGGVLKSVIVASNAERQGAKKPPLHSRCLVHYEGFLRDTGECFLRSGDEGRGPGEPAVVVAGRDASLRATGLNLAVAAMELGEKARVWIEDGDRYGYGPRGSFSFPAVPPSAKLVYDVELVAFEPPSDSEEDDAQEESDDGSRESGFVGDEGGEVEKKKKARRNSPRRSVGSLTYEERLEAAARRRLKGNALLTGSGTACANANAKGKIDPAAALAQYQLSLSYLDDDFLFQLEGPHLEAASSAARAARLNCAAARLALGDARGASDDATAVLRERPRDAKALFRRGKARRMLGDARGALEDLKLALEVEEKEKQNKPDAALLRELASAEKEVKASERAGDEVFRRAFATVGKKGLMRSGEEREEEGQDPSPFQFDDDGEESAARAGGGSAVPLSPSVAVFVAVAAVGVAVAAAASLRSIFFARSDSSA